jgi:hypothetical protein
MGIGKQKSHAKRDKVQSKKAAKRRNNAKLIHAERIESAVGADSEPGAAVASEESTPLITPLTGRQKHHEKVEQKRRIREMMNHKKAERQAIKKKTIDSDEKSIRKALCEEIKTLKSVFSFGGASAQPLGQTADDDDEEKAMADL